MTGYIFSHFDLMFKLDYADRCIRLSLYAYLNKCSKSINIVYN